MDLAPPPAVSPTRIAHLWEIAPVGPTRETSTYRRTIFIHCPSSRQLGLASPRQATRHPWTRLSLNGDCYHEFLCRCHPLRSPASAGSNK
jgi:hypothetical protein